MAVVIGTSWNWINGMLAGPEAWGLLLLAAAVALLVVTLGDCVCAGGGCCWRIRSC